MVTVSLFSAIMCVFAPFTIPIGAVPLSLSAFVLYLTAVILGKNAVFSVLVYIFIGAAGMPVFSGGIGGFEKLLGPTGGFIIGYIPCALISGLFADKYFQNRVMCFVGLMMGTIVMYAAGSAWMLYVMGADTFGSAMSLLTMNLFPFIPIDVLKMILALIWGNLIKRRIGKDV